MTLLIAGLIIPFSEYDIYKGAVLISNFRFSTIVIVLNVVISAYLADTTPSAQAVSRIGPVLSLLVSGDFNIDEYQEFTSDKALIDNHYFTDKAPLTTYLTAAIAIPVHGLGLFRFQDDGLSENMMIKVGTLICGVVPFLMIMTILAASFTRKVGREIGWLLAMLLCYGTNLFVYSVSIWGHLATAAFLLWGHVLSQERERPLLAGLALSLAVAADYTMGMAYAIYILYSLAFQGYRVAGRLVVGGVPVALALMYYHNLFGGNPFVPLYAHVADPEFQGMKSSMGLGLPKPSIMWELFFGPYRGILFYSPPLLFLFYKLLRKKGEPYRWSVLKNPAVLVCISHFLLISGYFVWWGGWCHGPRHLIPVLALLLYLGRNTWCREPFNPWLWLLAIVGTLGNWMTIATRTIYDEDNRWPLNEIILPRFLDEQFNAWTLPAMIAPSWYAVSIYLWPLLLATTLVTLIYLQGRRGLRGR